MKQKTEIITDLETEILFRLKNISTLQGEVDALNKTVSALRELDGGNIMPIKENNYVTNVSNYPGYPIDGTLIEKYHFLEDKTLRVWSKAEMESLIEHIEGPEQSKETLKSARQKTHYYINRGELIKLKYNNKNTYTFFTTRNEWIERNNDGERKAYRLLPEHEPESNLLSGLSEEQRRADNISWSGII